MSTRYMAVEGMHMHHLERQALRWLAAKVEEEHGDATTIMNIGIAAEYGHCSMRCLRAGSKQALMIGIDIKDQGEIPPELDTTKTMFVIGDSSRFIEKCPFLIHVAFVDGDHTNDGVEKDAKALFRIIKEGGYIAFHDYGHYGKPGFEHVYGVKTAVDGLFNGNEEWEYIRDVVSIRIFRRKKGPR